MLYLKVIKKKTMNKVKVKTTKDLFAFGFAWRNESSDHYMLAIIIGCIAIEIRWN